MDDIMVIQNQIRRLLSIHKSIKCVSEKTAHAWWNNVSLAITLLCFLPVGTATAVTKTKVMSLGDSLCEGNIAVLRSAVAQTKLGSTIDWVGTKKDGAYQDPDHECHGGWSAAQVLQKPKSNVRLPSWEGKPGSIRDWVQATKPDVVLIMLGTNDFFGSDVRGDNTSEFLTQSLQGIIDDILLLRPKARVVVASIPPFKWDIRDGVDTSQTRTTANAFVKQHVKQLSAQGKRVYFLDMNGAILARLKQGDIFSSDGLHFNDSGNKFIAQEWIHALKTVLQGRSTPIIPTTSKND
ncbi:MAG: hypothetical protein HXY43_17350 [Fischerella sp.]|uniref:GDSL-type esterase/lipase family protein n=1 Tax=Fischerella sp. TaxID=1191 RepID=UPI00178ECEFA|nr:GDSL-type esterase/lipase family protein [Fischerella sp.]NWF60970.1 hypothetical protein [Fischerella sp.]